MKKPFLGRFGVCERGKENLFVIFEKGVQLGLVKQVQFTYENPKSWDLDFGVSTSLEQAVR